MDIVITGASGFVGGKLFNFFKNKVGNVLPVIVRNNEIGGFNTLLQNIQTSTKIIHASGIAHDIKGVEKDSIYKQSNTDLSIKLIDAFLKSDAEDFIFFSSVKAVVDFSDTIVNEQTNPQPDSSYGQSKLEVEKYIQNLEIPQGKRIFILRPAMIYGADCKGNLPLLYSFIKKKLPYPFGRYKNERTFLNINNLLFAVFGIFQDKKIPGGIYMVSDDESYSTNDLVKELAIIEEMQPKIINVPIPIIKVIAKLGDGLNLPINSDRLEKLTQSLKIDNSKLKRALNISKMPYGLKEGLKEMVDNMPKNK
ncbi:MAG TPA: NAD-dependent epimerase/dehydratase family protein [Edaphocola sp.]|nr:NAD-dependent epimerase/dehydratase family protein [Edaphocola sp.]